MFMFKSLETIGQGIRADISAFTVLLIGFTWSFVDCYALYAFLYLRGIICRMPETPQHALAFVPTQI